MDTCGDKQFLQVFANADDEVIAFIKESTDAYGWGLYDEVRSVPRYDYSVVRPNEKRDRLTGYVLDETGDGYRVPVVVDGKVYNPRYFSCGSADCQVVGANLDFSDAGTIAWIKAADVDTIEKTSKALGYGSLVATGGASALLGTGSTTASLLAGYLKEDLKVLLLLLL